MLPTTDEIEKWDDDKLKFVYDLIFNKNSDPFIEGSSREEREEADYYMMEVDIEYEKRGFKNKKS